VILFYFLIDRFTGFLSIVSAFMNILQPVFLGLAIAFLANPIMMFFERLLSRFLIRENKKPNRWKLKRRKDFIRGVSTVLAVTLLIAIVAAFAVQILPQFIETVQYLINHLYEKIVGVIDWADHLTGYAFADTMEAARTDGRIYVWIDTAEKWLRDYLNLTEDNLAATVTEFSLHFGRVLVNVLIGIFIAIYMLIAKESFKGYSKRFVAAAFHPDIAEFILDVSRRGNQIFYGFIIGKIIDSIIIGIICWIGMTILGLNYSMLCSFIVGVTNVIPVFGPYIGALPTVILLFVTDPPQGIIFLIYILVLQQVDGNLIGRIKHRRARTACEEGRLCHSKQREGIGIGTSKCHLTEREEVERINRPSESVGIIHSILHAHAHVGNRKLTDDAVINILHSRVQYTLTVNNNVNFIRGDRKKMRRLNNLKALIHQGCGIYCNFFAHFPGWMSQSIGKSYVCKLSFRFSVKRTS
jgi:predicted PurR-regulated permease PerM